MNAKSNILNRSAIFIFFTFLFLLIYAPVFQGHYFVGEEYVRLWTSEWEGVTKQSYVSYTRTLPVEGRPLHTLFYYVIFNQYINLLKSYEAVNTVRFIAIIGVGLLAFVLYHIFKEYKVRSSHACLMSILICTLPPFQLYVGRLAQNIWVYSVLLSGLSALVLFKAVFKEDRGKISNILGAVAIASVLFIASLCIYQPTATVYWSMAVIPLIMLKDEDFIKKWCFPFIVYFITGVASMVIYFGIIKIYNMLLHIDLQARGDLINTGFDLISKLVWFVRYPLYTASNLWNIVRTQEVSLFVSIVILSGVLCGLIRVILQIRKEKKGWNLLWNILSRYFLIIIVIPLSYISHLVSKGLAAGQVMPNHRTLIGPDMIFLLLFFWGLMSIAEFFKSQFSFSEDLKKKIITSGLVILTVVVAFLANYNVKNYIVQPNTREYEYVKGVIQRYGVANVPDVSKIHIIGIITDKEQNDLIYREFSYRSTLGVWSSVGLVNLALYELGIDSYLPVDIPYQYIRIGDVSEKQLPEDKNILVIDMTKMKS